MVRLGRACSENPDRRPPAHCTLGNNFCDNSRPNLNPLSPLLPRSLNDGGAGFMIGSVFSQGIVVQKGGGGQRSALIIRFIGWRFGKVN